MKEEAKTEAVADIIRGLTDERLADFFDKYIIISDCSQCPGKKFCDADCRAGFLGWLKSPATDKMKKLSCLKVNTKKNG